MSNFIKQRYEYYKGTTNIVDNEVDEIVEDVVERLNFHDRVNNELLKIKQMQYEQIIDLNAQLKKAKAAQNCEGEWLLEREPDGTPYYLHCSVCDADFSQTGYKVATDYCPDCGAKMKTDKIKEVDNE